MSAPESAPDYSSRDPGEQDRRGERQEHERNTFECSHVEGPLGKRGDGR